MNDWVSAHLYFQASRIHGLAADVVIRDVVAPISTEWCSMDPRHRFFYVRYSEEAGQHIRLRFCSGHGIPTSAVRAFVQRSLEAGGYSKESAASHASDLRRSARRFRWVKYEPETDRYGGPDAVLVAEQFFHVSSVVALALLQQITEDRSTRIGKALVAAILALKEFLSKSDLAADVAKNYRDSCAAIIAGRIGSTPTEVVNRFKSGQQHQSPELRHRLQQAWLQLGEGEKLNAANEHYRAGLTWCRYELERLIAEDRVLVRGRRLQDWESCARYLLPSFMHMTNNRLGVDWSEEAYIAHLLYESLWGETASQTA